MSVRCATCDIEWTLDDLEQVQPDGRYVCPLWTGDEPEHQLVDQGGNTTTREGQ